jgi:hypothetical protein
MELRPFGRTGVQISAVGFGCWEIGGGYGSIEESEFVKALNRALDLGINCFDPAEAYGFGASEKSLAKALGSRREQAVITTRCGIGHPDAPNYRDSTRKRILESIDKSLKALNTDYVDVYLIHWPDRITPFEEPMQGARRSRQAGQGLGGWSLELQAERDRAQCPSRRRRERPATWTSDRADHCAVAGQSHVGRIDADRIHRDAALSKPENGGRARQSLVGWRKCWRRWKHQPA